MAELPAGIRLITSFTRDQWYRSFTFVLTFLLYVSFHLSRKPISIVKGELHKHCTASQAIYSEHAIHIQPVKGLPNESPCGWEPFDKNNYKQLLGTLDYSFLCAYAVGMYLSGIIGERLSIRYYLTGGMFASGLFTAMFGFGYFYNIHSLWFYIAAQIANGLVQTTGWPSVVTCIGNWFGKGRRGLIMGLWNSHTSVGNILGSLIAGYWVSTCWGLSFVVPGIIISLMGIVCFLFLIEHPKDINCTSTSSSNDSRHCKNRSDRFSIHKAKLTSKKANTSQLELQSDEEDEGIQVQDAPVVNEEQGVKVQFPIARNYAVDTETSQVQIGSEKEDSSQPDSRPADSNKQSDLDETGTLDRVDRLEFRVRRSMRIANRKEDPEMHCLLPENENCIKLLHHNNGVSEELEKGKFAISFIGALRIPGVVEFSLCLLFAKLVSYTFLFWLPLYITNVDQLNGAWNLILFPAAIYYYIYVSGRIEHLDAKKAGDLSTLFDVGGIFGGILAGVISDRLKKRATTCGMMLLVAAPTLYAFSAISRMGSEATIVMLFICGALVNGPYALITTAVSADLGTHKSLKGNARALSTVAAIIDGTGSVGAALGPLLAGLLSPSGWNNVFYMLMIADACALLFLLRLIRKELDCSLDHTLFKEH